MKAKESEDVKSKEKPTSNIKFSLKIEVNRFNQ